MEGEGVGGVGISGGGESGGGGGGGGGGITFGAGPKVATEERGFGK